MKSYKYTQLEFSIHGVNLSSTDSQMLDWILAGLKKTNLRVSAGKLASGEKYSLRMDQLRGEDFQVGWWILKQLYLQGGDPFAA